MNNDLVIILGDDRLLQYVGASAALAAFTTLAGFTAAKAAGDAGLAATLLLASLASGLLVYRGVVLHNRIAEVSGELRLLADLLEEGVDAEPGRLVIQAGYTGELVPRSYTLSSSFRPSGDPTVVDMESIRGWKPRYTLVSIGDAGVLDAEAYRVKLGSTIAYITRLHENIESRVSRERLVTRRGGEYAETLIEAAGPIVTIVASHVGRTTRARIEVRVSTPIEASAKLAVVKGRSERVILPLAPYTPTTLILSDMASPSSIASRLGSKPVLYGHSVEARIRLLLTRGPLTLDSDEALLRTLQA